MTTQPENAEATEAVSKPVPLSGIHYRRGCIVDYDSKSVTFILECKGLCDDPEDLAGLKFKLGEIRKEPMDSVEFYEQAALKFNRDGLNDIGLKPVCCAPITIEEYNERYGDE